MEDNNNSGSRGNTGAVTHPLISTKDLSPEDLRNAEVTELQLQVEEMKLLQFNYCEHQHHSSLAENFQEDIRKESQSLLSALQESLKFVQDNNEFNDLQSFVNRQQLE